MTCLSWKVKDGRVSLPNLLLTGTTTHEFRSRTRGITSMEIAKSAERIEKLMILHHGG